MADLSRRGSIYVRQQYDRDPRQTLIVAGVAAAVFVLVLVLIVSTFSGGGDSTTATNEGDSTQPGIGTPLPTGGTNGGAATAAPAAPSAAAAQPLPGTPYSETAVLDAMRSRGLTVAATTDQFACDNPGTTPRTFRVTANGAEQPVVLLVYPDAAAFGRDWAATGGRPQYRNGSCAAGAAVMYFNVNAMIVFPQTNNAGVQQQIADAFLTLP